MLICVFGFSTFFNADYIPKVQQQQKNEKKEISYRDRTQSETVNFRPAFAKKAEPPKKDKDCSK